MSEDNKKKIDETKAQFLNEIAQEEQDILDEVAGGRAFDDTINQSSCTSNTGCGGREL